jgi:LmbE family N-acetylglucosaminyl deacetylase
VCFPLGLFHSDHVLASDAVIGLVPAHPDIAWWAFEDALYRSLDNAVAERVDLLRRRRLLLEAVPAPPGAADTARRKHAAIACYRSQLRGLATPNRLGDRDARSPETYWRVRG